METLKVRIDKWLWAARFFKTRAMATEAVNGGKVHCNGQRVKPSRIVQVGDEMRVQRGVVEMTVSVMGINDQRRPAKEAVELYQETAASFEAREKQRENRHLLRSIHDNARPSGRPGKRDRRLIRNFVRNDEES